MIVQCGHCGAPLDVNETETIVRCRYCGTKNERARTRTIAEQTPADFTPPPKWRPPPEFPADSDKELTYAKSSGSSLGCAIVALVVIVPCIIAAGAAFHDCTGVLGNEPSKLAALETLDGTPQALGAQLSQSTVNESSLWADLHDSRFVRVSFSWDQERLDHPSSFYFGPRGDKPTPDPAIRKRLGEMLHGGLAPDGSWSWENVNLGFDDKTGAVNGSVRADHNPQWKKQLDAAWKIAVHAVFGLDVKPTPADMTLLLGAGYPLADLGKVAPSITVDGAETAIGKVFPGAVVDSTSGVRAKVALDHAVFGVGELNWYNQRGATMNHLELRPFRYNGPFDQNAMLACLSKTWLSAVATEMDFMKKTRSYRWSVDGASVELYPERLAIYFQEKTIDSAAWVKMIGVIAACR